MWRVWTNVFPLCCAVALLLAGAAPFAVAQEPDGLAAVAAIERTLVEAIAKAEQSVVSIARIKRTTPQMPQDDLPIGVPIFNRNRIGESDPDDPANPDFIPTDFGSGVVIG